MVRGRMDATVAMHGDTEEWGSHARCGRRLACRWLPLAVVVALLGTARPVRAAFEDGVLKTPWTEEEHTSACPGTNDELCPVLPFNTPIVKIKSVSDEVALQEVATLSSAEISEGATTPFHIYSRKPVPGNPAEKTYNNFTGSEASTSIRVTFTITMGSIDYLNGNQRCGIDSMEGGTPPTPAAAGTGSALGEEATLQSGPLSFRIVASISQINCFLPSVRVRKSGGAISSERQMATFGAMTALTVKIENAPGYVKLAHGYSMTSVIYYDPVVNQPKIGVCPTMSYPYPSTTQLPSTGLPAISQPVGVAEGWSPVKDVMTKRQGGLCWSNPVASYPPAQPAPNKATCTNLSYFSTSTSNDQAFAPTCAPCAKTATSWFYVFEDSPTVLSLNEITFEDGSFFSGSAEVDFEVKFDTDSPTAENPASLSATQGNAASFKYCAHTLSESKKCASSPSEAFNNIWVPESGKTWGQDYQMRILNATNQGRFCKPGATCPCPGTSCPVNGNECPSGPGSGDFFDNEEHCPCNDGQCYTINPARTHMSRGLPGTGRSRLWFEIFETSSGKVMQMGYMDISIASAGNVTGNLYSYPSSVGCTLTDKRRCPNWFRFSPMTIAGSYNEGDGRRLTIKATTDASLLPNFDITVMSEFGLVHFPKNGAGVTKVPAVPAKRVALSGNLRELTITLSSIQYQVNHSLHPNLNTQTKGRASSNSSEHTTERIRLVYDKGQMGANLIDPGNVGSITVFDLPVTILATNDKATFKFPINLTTNENQVMSVPDVSIEDVDIDEVFVDSTEKVPSGMCPTATGEAHHPATLTLSSGNGKVFINVSGADSVLRVDVSDSSNDRLTHSLISTTPRELIEKLMRSEGDFACGLDNRRLCMKIPSKYLTIPTGGSEVSVFVGARLIQLKATLSCLNQALTYLKYMGLEDYNNNVPAQAPADKTGCPAAAGQILQKEYINLTLHDNGYSGCVESAGITGAACIPITVIAVQQNIRVNSPEIVEAIQDSRFFFSDYRCNEVAQSANVKCGAIQVQTRDNGDLALLSRRFKVRLSTMFGTLTFKEKADDLKFLIGNGTDNKVVQMFGKLCDINVALRTLSYTPQRSFVTEYDSVNKTWTPSSNKEEITVLVEQPSADGLSKVGPDTSFKLPVSIKAVDKEAEVSLIMPGQSVTRRQVTPFPLQNRTADIYFCGGRVPCNCPEKALACVRLEDQDSCNAKTRNNVACDSHAVPSANPRLVIRSEHSDVWFFDGDIISSWVSGSACSSHLSSPVSERHVKELEDYHAGRNLRAIDVMIPLPLIQSGVLRVWASPFRYGSDVLEISLQGPLLEQGIRTQNTPLAIRLDNAWCATLNPVVCLGADPQHENRFHDGGISGPAVVISGLIICAATLMLVIGLSPGAGIAYVTGIRSLSRYRGESSEHDKLELSRVQETLQELQGGEDLKTHAGSQWVMARDNRRRPFWYHTITRQTTRTDPSCSDSDLRQRSHGTHGDFALDAMLERQGVMADETPTSLKPHELAANGSVDQEQIRFQHPETGEIYGAADIDPRNVKVDFPGAWNAQANINDIDNSLVTAMLLTKSQWIRDQDKSGAMSKPIHTIIKKHTEDQRRESRREVQQLRNLIGESGIRELVEPGGASAGQRAPAETRGRSDFMATDDALGALTFAPTPGRSSSSMAHSATSAAGSGQGQRARIGTSTDDMLGGLTSRMAPLSATPKLSRGQKTGTSSPGDEHLVAI